MSKELAVDHQTKQVQAIHWVVLTIVTLLTILIIVAPVIVFVLTKEYIYPLAHNRTPANQLCMEMYAQLLLSEKPRRLRPGERKNLGESLDPAADIEAMTCAKLLKKMFVPILHVLVSISRTYIGVVRNATT